jgi:hypothetical protein
MSWQESTTISTECTEELSSKLKLTLGERVFLRGVGSTVENATCRARASACVSEVG